MNAPDSVSLLSALAAGLISFISPCVLPLVPVYLSTMTGLTAEELETQGSEKDILRRILSTGLAFCAGLTVIFVALGLTATALGQFLIAQLRMFELVAGILVVVFGLHMTGLLKVSALYRSFKVKEKAPDASKRHSVGKSFLMGLAFAFGWTPCVGPILAAVLALAATQETVAKGGILLFTYSLGLAVPFLLAGLAFGWFAASYQKIRQYLRVIEMVSGGLLIIFGLLMATHRFTMLAGWLARWLPEPGL